MINFQCDYAEGCHPILLEALTKTNMEQTTSYGCDIYSKNACAMLRTACGSEDADVHFLVGGTQTNATVIASVLRHHQGVVSADSGHIAMHETGAIEATGHKILCIPSEDGTISAEQIEALCHEHFTSPIQEHMVQPGLVYISFPTESGTLYSKAQLTAIKKVCKAYDLPLYIDGARMGYGLVSTACDLTLQDIANLCDVFYIGGTKCGALFGEAVVIINEALKKDFRYAIKQHGGLLAKGRLLGVQFEALFENGLYFDICRQAIEHALAIRKAFEDKGMQLWGTSYTNQQFVILTDAQMKRLTDLGYEYEVWVPSDVGQTVVRFCTSWATTAENTQRLIDDIKAL